MVFAQGDIVTFNYNPTKGHEPAGARPSVVVSNDEFNLLTSMTLCCPITSHDNGFPLHYKVPKGLSVSGFICLEQLSAKDLIARKATVIDRLPQKTIDEVAHLLRLEL